MKESKECAHGEGFEEAAPKYVSRECGDGYRQERWESSIEDCWTNLSQSSLYSLVPGADRSGDDCGADVAMLWTRGVAVVATTLVLFCISLK